MEGGKVHFKKFSRLRVKDSPFKDSISEVINILHCHQVVRLIGLESLASHCCGFESCQRLLIFSCEEIIQPAYRMSVVLLVCLLVAESSVPVKDRKPSCC